MIALYLSVLPDPSDKAKFEEFYEEYRKILLKLCYEHIHDYDLAEDCTHEIFLYFAQNFDKVGKVDSAKTKAYVNTVGRGFACRFYKESIKESFLDDIGDETEIGDDIDYADLVHNEMEVSLLSDCIEALEEPFREAFILRFLHDSTYAEIAKMLNVSEGNARKIIERARKKLIEELKKRKSSLVGDNND